MRINVQWNIIQPDKASTSVSLTKAFDYVDHNFVKFLKRKYQGPASAESRDTLRMDSIGEKRGREKEWHGEAKLRWRGPSLYFQRKLLYPELYTEKCRVIQSQLNIPSLLTFIDTRFLPAYRFINKGLIFCTLSSGPEACWHFMITFW